MAVCSRDWKMHVNILRNVLWMVVCVVKELDSKEPRDLRTKAVKIQHKATQQKILTFSVCNMISPRFSKQYYAVAKHYNYKRFTRIACFSFFSAFSLNFVVSFPGPKNTPKVSPYFKCASTLLLWLSLVSLLLWMKGKRSRQLGN